MTAATMLRRLAKLEVSVMPRPQKSLRILFQPGTGDPDAWAQHEQDITEAKANGDWLAVVRFITPGVKRESREVEGVKYYDSDWEAELAPLLATLGPDGTRELWHSLSGDVFGVASHQSDLHKAHGLNGSLLISKLSSNT